MELEYIISALSSFAALVAGGGWVSYKTKKVADVQRNKSDNVDLTDKILEKYQKSFWTAWADTKKGTMNLTNKYTRLRRQ